MRTDSLELYSNAREAKAVEVAVRLEQFRRVLALSIPGFSTRPLDSTRVVLFKNSRSFEPYSGLMKPRAYYLRNRFESFIVLNATPPSVTRARASEMLLNPYTFHPYHDIYHEFTHYLVDNNMSDLPPWLNEGLAEYYATFSIDKDSATIGLPIEARRIFLGRNWDSWLPHSALFYMTAPAAVIPFITAMFYSESWAVVHYLVNASDERRMEFEKYLVLLARGMPRELAFSRSFSVDEEKLLKEAKHYNSRTQLPYYTLDSSQVDLQVEPEVSTVSHQDALALLGTLLVSLSPLNAEHAEEHFEAALAIDASHAGARLGMAIAADADGRLDDAAQHYREAAELASDNGQIRLRSGFNRLAAVEEIISFDRPLKVDLAPVLSKARAAFEAALAQDQDSVQACLGLGRSYLYGGDVHAAALSCLDRARHLEPDEGRVPLTLALLYLRNGGDDQAEGTVRAALRTYPFNFLAVLRSEMGRLLIPVARGHSLAEQQISDLLALLQSMAVEEPAPALPSAVLWADLEPQLASLERYAKLLEVSRAIAADERERARGLLDTLLEELEDDEDRLHALGLGSLLDEERTVAPD